MYEYFCNSYCRHICGVLSTIKYIYFLATRLKHGVLLQIHFVIISVESCYIRTFVCQCLVAPIALAV